MQPFVAGVFFCQPHNPKVVFAARSATEKLISGKLLKYLQTGLYRYLECSRERRKWGIRPPVWHSQSSSSRRLVVGAYDSLG